MKGIFVAVLIGLITSDAQALIQRGLSRSMRIQHGATGTEISPAPHPQLHRQVMATSGSGPWPVFCVLTARSSLPGLHPKTGRHCQQPPSSRCSLQEVGMPGKFCTSEKDRKPSLNQNRPLGFCLFGSLASQHSLERLHARYAGRRPLRPADRPNYRDWPYLCNAATAPPTNSHNAFCNPSLRLAKLSKWQIVPVSESSMSARSVRAHPRVGVVDRPRAATKLTTDIRHCRTCDATSSDGD